MENETLEIEASFTAIFMGRGPPWRLANGIVLTLYPKIDGAFVYSGFCPAPFVMSKNPEVPGDRADMVPTEEK